MAGGERERETACKEETTSSVGITGGQEVAYLASREEKETEGDADIRAFSLVLEEELQKEKTGERRRLERERVSRGSGEIGRRVDERES